MATRRTAAQKRQDARLRKAAKARAHGATKAEVRAILRGKKIAKPKKSARRTSPSRTKRTSHRTTRIGAYHAEPGVYHVYYTAGPHKGAGADIAARTRASAIKKFKALGG
jgi:hypothetical protein